MTHFPFKLRRRDIKAGSLRQWTKETITCVIVNTISLIGTSAQLEIGFNRFPTSNIEMQTEFERVCDALSEHKDAVDEVLDEIRSQLKSPCSRIIIHRGFNESREL